MCFSEPDTVGVKVKRAVSKEKANKGICFRHQSIYYVVFVYPVRKYILFTEQEALRNITKTAHLKKGNG